MNYQSSTFGSECSVNKNVKKGLKVEISQKIYMIFLFPVNTSTRLMRLIRLYGLYVLQKSKKVKFYL